MNSMTEEKTKKRDWVKNAAIIFLTILLILTFFSNTILNWSLPEVAIQYVTSGSISAQIRGTGTITPVEQYEVKINESRKVQTVYVQVGQEIKVGDLLFVLSTGDSEELESAKTALEEAQYQYQTALINASSADYAQQNREIAKLREDIEELNTQLTSMSSYEEDYNNATLAVESAQAAVNVAETEQMLAQEAYDAQYLVVEEIKAKRDQYSPGSGDSSGVTAAEAEVKAAEAALAEAQTALETARLQYLSTYAALENEAIGWIISDYDSNLNEGEKTFAELSAEEQTKIKNEKLPSYLPALINQKYSDPESAENIAYTQMTKALNDVAAAENSLETAKRNYTNATNSYIDANGNSGLYYMYNRQYNEENEKLTKLNSSLETAKKSYERANNELTKLKTTQEEAKAKVDERKALEDQIETAEDSLADALFTLSQTQKEDNKQSQLTQLDLERQRKNISELQEKVDSLSGEGGATEIRSEVNGVVKTVSITAGNTTTPDTALITLEVPDRGYNTTISVTNEQAQKVQVGTFAQVSTGWWGSSNIEARLASMRTDPQNPRTNKLLVFELTGDDLESGSSITLSIGERSQNYDAIVPKSAVRTDSNGSFVLIVESRQSPLGNRYTAKRMDVTVVAEDDVNCAVSGAITTSECVITTSTAPVENGDQVRMAE